MQRPERLRWFALRLSLGLMGAYLAWTWVEPVVIQTMWLVSNELWPSMFRDGLIGVQQRESLWLVRTGWRVISEPGTPVELATVSIGLMLIQRVISGFPLLVALVIATATGAERRLRAAACFLALAAWWLISWLAVTAYAWHSLAVLRNNKASYVDRTMVPPPFKLAVDAYPMWEYYLSGYATYLSILIVPVLAPVVIWAAAFRRPVTRLVLRMHRRVRTSRGTP